MEFTPPPPPEVRREPRAGRGLLAVRVLRPPLEIEVITRGDGPEGSARLAPLEIRTPASEEAAKRPRVEGEVKVASGPWGLEEDWWADDPVGRDYWDVELAGPRALPHLSRARDRRLVCGRHLRLTKKLYGTVWFGAQAVSRRRPSKPTLKWPLESMS